MKTGFKFRCYPDQNQQQLIHQTTGNARFIYRYHSLNNGLLNNNSLNSNKQIPILLSRQEDECPPQACGETVRLESNPAIQQVSMKQEV